MPGRHHWDSMKSEVKDSPGMDFIVQTSAANLISTYQFFESPAKLSSFCLSLKLTVCKLLLLEQTSSEPIQWSFLSAPLVSFC